MIERKISIQGIETNYKIAGEGDSLLILHGWGASSDSWLKVQKILAKQGYQVICPDLPGFGKSKLPLKAWSVSDYTDWLLNFVDSLKIKKFFLVAHSFGGRIAIKFANYYPQKIRRLVLCGPAGIPIKPDIKTAIILLFSELGNTIFSFKFLRIFKDGARNFFYFFLRNRDYVKAKGIMRETMKKITEEDLSPCLSRIISKTLIIWGENDRMVPLKYAQVFKKNIKNSQLEILPKIGHSPHLENPKKLANILKKFLK